jgi:transposase
MLYVGLDVHAKHITVCVLNHAGKVHDRWQADSLDQLVTRLQRLEAPFQVCYEAGTGYGWLHESLTPLASRIVVAHPGQLRLIFRSKRKSDRRDAEKLAQLLYLGMAPAVHVPSAKVRAWRELITLRQRLVGKRTRVKNSLRMLLRSVGVQAPPKPGLWTRRGQAWLKQVEFQQSSHRLTRDLLIEELELLNANLKQVERELEAFSRDDSRVWLLQSIPGVGLRTAETLVAFIDDPHRFANSKKVGAYFGQVPSQDQSGDKNRLGRITREGPAVARQYLAEAAWQAIRRSPTIKAFYERVRRDDPKRKKIALVATAHYLSRVAWAMLRDGSLWRETVPAPAATVL